MCHNKTQKYAKSKKELCKTKVEFRAGTFFENSKLSIFQILGFVNLWVDAVPLKVICCQLEIDRSAAVNWSSFCREVVLDAFIANPMKLGGPGKIVEIDESKFGKRKYHRGHHVEGQWVFGGYERGSGRVFMIAVEKRDANTLIPIIQQWIEPGTTIISDFWKAYDCLNLAGFKHLKVNHSLHFKDPETGAHTNAIESSWRAAKASMSPSGRRKAHIPGNLARYMFFKKCKDEEINKTIDFFKLAGRLYPGKKKEKILENVPLDFSELSDEDIFDGD